MKNSHARKPCAPLIEILFPHDKFLHGNILPRNSFFKFPS